jgi:uncharacterized protein (TIGR00369 family)
MSLESLLIDARATADFGPLLERIPYARFLGFSLDIVGEEVTGKLTYSDHLVGNPRVGALHGGTLGALLELTGAFQLLYTSEAVAVPKTVSITVDYLRQAHKIDTFARASVTRHGRRIANVRIVAFQEDETRPVATANVHYLVT